MARTFGCEVHAFDPSPVSIKWWNSNHARHLRSLPNYHFHPYGAGGVDGEVILNEYNWDQVSIMRYPSIHLDCNEGKDSPHCGVKFQESQQFQLPVKTLPTIRRELGHEGRTIDILKIDVEGSEYSFMENMFDTQGGCPHYVNQLTLEWHHMPWDARYGEGSSPSINALATLMHACGLKMFWQFQWGGWPSKDRIYQEMGLHDMRYNVASFHRENTTSSMGASNHGSDKQI